MGAKFEYPIVVQESWVKNAIVSTYENRTYSSNIIQKNFIKKSKTCCGGPTPLVRIFQFMKVTKDGGLSGILSDSTHQVAAKFSYECVRRFEDKYKQRITYNTQNTMFVIRTAHLRYLTRFEAGDCEEFKLIIEVADCDIFSYDQVMFDVKIDQQLRLVYGEPEFKAILNRPKFSVSSVNQLVSDDYDDMVSL